ncbi:unnamed protein product [Allacma fusca]|uniref:5-demethoxyubiquinone hydroxylase, mitochondrial n=1 Tax=Allacma fusca TaxID=39272 RepID=A0A8J2PUH8_9HEXA|nr:unnamed protein product [Allacma fusca]
MASQRQLWTQGRRFNIVEISSRGGQELCRGYSSTVSQAQKLKNRAQEERLRQIRDRIIRVDHAGEYGANRIYAGQMAVLGKTKSGPLIQHMWDQEKVHLDIFNKLIPKYRARPTAFLPIWDIAGFALGAGTALLGEKAAMACTVAVEASIVEHYNNQIRELMASTDNLEDNKEILDYIQKCRDEEQEHHDTGLEQEAEKTPGYNLLYNAIKTGCKTAIWLSERV